MAYTKEELDRLERDALSRGGDPATVRMRRQQLEASAQPQQAGLVKLVGGIGKAIAKPAVTAGRMVLGTGAATAGGALAGGGKLYEGITGNKTGVDEAGFGLANFAANKILTPRQREVSDPNKVGLKAELDRALEGGKTGAGVASYLVPGVGRAGAGMSALQRIALAGKLGTLTGGFRSLSETQGGVENIGNIAAETVTGALVGGGTGAAMQGIGEGLKYGAGKLSPKIAQKQQMRRLEELTKKKVRGTLGVNEQDEYSKLATMPALSRYADTDYVGYKQLATKLKDNPDDLVTKAMLDNLAKNYPDDIRFQEHMGEALQPKDIATKALSNAKQSAEDARVDLPTKMYAKKFIVPTKLAGKDRLDVTGTSKKMMDYGVGKNGDLNQMREAANTVTGKDGILATINRDVISKTDKVLDIADIGDDVAKVAAKKVGVPKDTRDEVLKVVQGIIDESDATTPKGAYDAIHTLEELGYNEYSKSTYLTKNPLREDLGDIYIAGAKSLEKKLSAAVDETKLIETYKTAGVIDALKGVSPKLSDEFSKATSVKELRSLQAPFVKLGMILDQTDQGSYSQFSRLSQAAGDQGPIEHLYNATIKPTVDVLSEGATTPVANRFASAVGSGLKSVGNIPRAVSPTIGKGAGAAGDIMTNRFVQGVATQVGALKSTGAMDRINPQATATPASGVSSLQTQATLGGAGADSSMADRPINVMEATQLARQGIDVSKLWVISPDGTQIWNPTAQKSMPYTASQYKESAGGAGQPSTDQSIAQLDDILAKHDRLLTGQIGGRLSSVAKPFGNVAVTDFDSAKSNMAYVIAADILELKPLTEVEVELIKNEVLPAITDTKAQAKAKIDNLKRLIIAKQGGAQ